MKQTVADAATAAVFKLLGELPPDLDERTYNRALSRMWEVIVLDIDEYIHSDFVRHRFEEPPGKKEQVRSLRQLLAWRPITQAAVQTFFNTYIPQHPQLVTRCVVSRTPRWRENLHALLEKVPE